MTQLQKIFYDNSSNRSKPHLPPPPTDNEVRLMLAENNANCPLNDIIVSKSNEGNMRTLRRFAFTALKRANRSLRGCNFGVYCPPGQGKTFIVKKFAETIGIPMIFVQSPVLENSYMLFELIRDEFEKFGTPLVLLGKDSKFNYYIPPCIVFFDEAHELPSSMMKGSLLNAMEADDATMIIKQPGTKGATLSVDCWEVCWIAATTERGDLFDAFDSRLPTAIEWNSAGGAELAKIVKAGLDKKVKTGEIPFSPPESVCEMITKYQSVPRIAIHGFGTKVAQHKDYMPSCTWEECCKIVAADMGINHHGFTEKQMAILKSLGSRPIAENRLATVANCRLAQVKKYELPSLMQYTNGGPLIVSVSGRGMCITRAGLKKLDEMGISHSGDKITAEHFESTR